MQELLNSNCIRYLVLSKEEVMVKGSMSGIGVRKTLPSSCKFHSMMYSPHLLISSLPPDVKSKCSQDWAAICNCLVIVSIYFYPNHWSTDAYH